MELVKANKDLQQKTRREEISDFEIQRKKHEHFLRIIFSIVLTGIVFFLQIVELAIIVTLYLKERHFPTEIISVLATSSLLKILVMRRILNYIFPANKKTNDK